MLSIGTKHGMVWSKSLTSHWVFVVRWILREPKPNRPSNRKKKKKKKKKMSTIEQIAGMGCFCSNMKPCRILTSKNGEQMGVCPNWTKENPVSCGMYLRPSSLTCNCHDDLTGRKYPITWTRNSVWKDGRTGKVLGCIRKKGDPRRCNFKTQYEESA